MNQTEDSQPRIIPHDSNDNVGHQAEQRTLSRTGHQDSIHDSEAILDQDLPREITFEKRSIPKQRTQSIQSVLSSVSLKSLAHSQVQNPQNKKPFVPQLQNPQAQFINAKTHIQAPALANSTKRRASFEIGQRLPFNKEEAVESDGDAEASEEQAKLTEDALRRLSSLSKFTPAEVDLSMSSKSTSNLPIQVTPIMNNVKAQQLSISISRSKDGPNSSEFTRNNGTINNTHGAAMRSSLSTPSLARRPSSNPSSASRIRGEPPKLLSTTTSSQNLSTITPFNKSKLNPQQQQQQQTLKPHQQHNIQVSQYKTKHSQSFHQIQEEPQPSSPHLIDTPSSPPNPSSPNPSFGSQEERRGSIKSNRANLQTLSDPKRPMYIPAVLRQSSTNLKPEDIRHINELNSRKGKGLLTDAATSLRSQTSHWKLSFGDYNSNKTIPTRAHWRRDTSRTSCGFCEKEFTFFERRHHCRRCGDIFCAEHTSHLLKLGPDAQFTIGGSGVLCKVCDSCCKDYEGFVKRKFGELNNAGKKENHNIGNNERKKSITENSTQGATVVPADWSWSSF